MTAIEFLTAIGGTKSLSTLDGFARTVWQRWGAKEVTDEQGPGAGGGDRGPQARGARSRHGGATGTACGGAGEGAGEAEPFSAQAEGVAFARSAGVDRAASDAGGVRAHAAATGQPIHNGGAGGVAPGRGRGAGQAALHAHPWRARSPRGRWDHHRPQRHPRGRRPWLSDHRGAAPRQATQSLQCRANCFPRMACLDRARPKKFERRPSERQGFRFPGGRVQKNGAHG